MTQPDDNTAPNPDKRPHPDTHLAPIPDPEPASPSLDEPDPAVFHHTPVRPENDYGQGTGIRDQGPGTRDQGPGTSGYCEAMNRTREQDQRDQRIL